MNHYSIHSHFYEISVWRVLFYLSLLLLLIVSIAASAEPSLQDILQACEYLQPGDIPEDIFAPPKDVIYVAPREQGGDDSNDGLSIDKPFEHLDRAIDYVNNHSDTPYTIYLRQGVYLFKDPKVHTDNPYLNIQRGNLYISGYLNEKATIRPYFWPGNPTEYGDERAFDITGPFENITFSNLAFEGWSLIFQLGSLLETAPLRNITLKNISAPNFTRRGGSPDYGTGFLETGYVENDVYGEGKVIFDAPDNAKYQIENLILSHISVNGVDIAMNIGDENDANVKGMRITHFEVVNASAESGNSASDGFAIVNSYKILIDHCRLVNINDDGIDSKSYNMAVVNTYVEGTGRNAVKFWRNGELINSILYNCTQIDDGAIIVKEGPFRMINSVLLEHPVGYAGTYGYDETQPVSNRLLIANSVFGRVRSFYVNTANFNALHNRFCDLVDDASLFDGVVFAGSAEALNALPNCAGNALSTLQFVNPNAADFSLIKNSEWIDAGASAGVKLPAFDFLGNARIAGKEVDIGPIEYGSTPIVLAPDWPIME